MEKRDYTRPDASIEMFVPNHYCETCFEYDIVLHCLIDEGTPHGSNGTYEDGYSSGQAHLHRYAHCGTNYIHVKITNGEAEYNGTESIPNYGQTVNVEYVKNVEPSVESLPYPPAGAKITHAEWKSYLTFGTQRLEYIHHGDGELLNKTMTLPGHPNHS